MTYPPPYATPPAPKPKHTLRTVLIVVGIVMVLCCGGAVAGGIALFRGLGATVGPARDAADGYLDDLEAGNTDAAYSQLCAGYQDQYTRTEFADLVAGRPTPSGHTINGVNVNTTNGVTRGTATVTLLFDDDSSETHVINLTREAGDWRVCANPY